MEAQLLEYRRKKEKEHKSKSNFIYKLFSDSSSNGKNVTKAKATVTEQPSDLSAEDSVTSNIDKPVRKQVLHPTNEQEAESPVNSSTQFTKWRPRILLCLYVVLWLMLWKFFIEIQFGAVYFILSVSIICYINTRTGPSDPRQLSAYSVFNANQERLDGTFTTEQFEKELRFGAASVK